jgi:hypothetical protein
LNIFVDYKEISMKKGKSRMRRARMDILRANAASDRRRQRARQRAGYDRKAYDGHSNEES